jgi:hypothetical protein
LGPIARRRHARPGISGLIAGLFVFGMIFTVGTGFFIFVNTVNTAYVKSLSDRSTAMQDQLSETLQVSGAAGAGNHLTITATNTGAKNANVTDILVVDPGRALHTYGIGFASNTAPALPLPVSLAGSSPSLDTALVIAAGTYTIKVITQRGNAFVASYPPPPAASGPGGNALLVQMIATPPQALGGATITDTVTVSNYASAAVTAITLNANPPLASLTGTATLTGGSCTPASYASIPAYPGSGNPSSVTFTCTYTAHTGTSGGLASFSGYAQGTLAGVSIASPSAVSNTVQIGSTFNVLNQGPFSINSFFFKYTSCTNPPAGVLPVPGFSYASSCATNPASMPPASTSNLLGGSLISGGTNYYSAFYVELTNNFNTTLVILQYSYVFLDPTNGGESSYYIVGPATSPYSTYYPNYASDSLHKFIPQLTPYTGNAVTCAETAPLFAPPPPTTCLDIAPQQTMTLTFAACGFGASNWSWGGTQYARAFDNVAGCTTVTPYFVTPEGTYLSIIISFIYNGVDYTQAIPFQGQIILP